MRRPLSPKSKICQVETSALKHALETVFTRWGTPKMMKFDNGAPFGDPKRSFPPPLSLWLTGLGITVVWNAPRKPQQNAKVERMQGLSASWSIASKCTSLKALAANLAAACTFQREKYPTRTCQGRTRAKKYPELLEGGAKFHKDRFDFARVAELIGKGKWERKVSKNGQVEFRGMRLYVGMKHARQIVCISYDPATHQWRLNTREGAPIKRINARFSKESIQNLAPFKK